MDVKATMGERPGEIRLEVTGVGTVLSAEALTLIGKDARSRGALIVAFNEKWTGKEEELAAGVVGANSNALEPEGSANWYSREGGKDLAMGVRRLLREAAEVWVRFER